MALGTRCAKSGAAAIPLAHPSAGRCSAAKRLARIPSTAPPRNACWRTQVASKTADVAGDGTSTATVLAQAIVKEGMKYVTARMNPMDLKRGIDSATETVVAELKTLSKPCSTNKEIAQLAALSANSDTAPLATLSPRR